MSARSVIVTGADGFIGRNLRLRLSELDGWSVLPLTRESSPESWADAFRRGDAVVHLAGVNRPDDPADFAGNDTSVAAVIDAMRAAGRRVPVVLASSIKAGENSDYGASKLAAEQRLLAAANADGVAAAVVRLPNVFGKWCRPNYNSAVATFCHNIARDLPVRVDDPAAVLTLVYVDDVIDGFVRLIADGFATGQYEIGPVHRMTVGAVLEQIRGFRADRDQNLIAEVGQGLTRALYATYVSYLPVEAFSYPIAAHRDPRGAFSEMLKTRTSGQFSYFNALPGVTRGGHYHHTKTEKFLIVHGRARFRFRNMMTGETHEILTSADRPEIVETIPGWAHDVTNIGDDVMVSLLWANEIFDRTRPDTIAQGLDS